MTVLEFNNYRVNELSYSRNNNFKSQNKEINLPPDIKSNFDIKDNKIYISLTVLAGSIDDSKVPFQVKCSLTGEFIYHAEEDDTKVGLDELVHKNAVAILYPYVRNIISNLTLTSNEFPAYILPTINVSKVLKE